MTLLSLAVLLSSCVFAAGLKNVLHIVADDLRPDLRHAYGATEVDTPHLDALSRKSHVFVNAYCQQPICSPSRNSFMTGLRPDRTKAWNFINYWRQAEPDASSLPQYFKDNGYLALGAGKLYHSDNPPKHDEPLSWSPESDGSQEYFEPAWQTCPPAPNGQIPGHCVNDTLPMMEDYQTVNRTLQHLRMAKEQGKNFYIGAGFHRPHHRYIMPEASFKPYVNRTISPAAHSLMHESVPDVACIINFGIRTTNGTGYNWNPKSQAVPQEVQIELRRYYYAAITWVDHLVGLLIAGLEELGLSNSTAVLFHSDHGYFLGESGEWEKKMLFENSVRVPLIVFDPERPFHDRRTDFAELVDIFPTAVKLAGLPMPSHVDGTALLGNTPAKEVAFTQFPRCPRPNEDIAKQACYQIEASDFEYMGYSVRTTEWRYTEWRHWDGAHLQAVWNSSGLVAQELYNHTGHFADTRGNFDFEQVNVVSNARHSDAVADLSARLRAQFDSGVAREELV